MVVLFINISNMSGSSEARDRSQINGMSTQMCHRVDAIAAHERLEDEVMDAVRAVLIDYGPPLQERGLECVLHPLKREHCETANYSSELRIDFKDLKGIVDVLEFHVVRDGRPLVTVREVEDWLRQEVEGLAST